MPALWSPMTQRTGRGSRFNELQALAPYAIYSAQNKKAQGLSDREFALKQAGVDLSGEELAANKAYYESVIANQEAANAIDKERADAAEKSAKDARNLGYASLGVGATGIGIGLGAGPAIASGITAAAPYVGSAALAAGTGYIANKQSENIVQVGKGTEANKWGGKIGTALGTPFGPLGQFVGSTLGRAVGGLYSNWTGRGITTKDNQVTLRVKNRNSYTQWADALKNNAFGGDPDLIAIGQAIMTGTGKKRGKHPFAADKVPDYLALNLQYLPDPKEMAQIVAANRAGDTKFKPQFDTRAVEWLSTRAQQLAPKPAPAPASAATPAVPDNPFAF